MKLTLRPVLFLSLLLLHTDPALAGKKGKGGGMTKITNLFKKPSKTKEPAVKKQPTNYNQRNYPQQPGNYPQQPGSYPGQPGNYPQQPGSYPRQPGNYPQQPGSYPQQPGSYPQQPGSYPQQPGSYPQQPGSYPQQPGGYPRQPGNYPQQPGNYPQQPGSYPQQPGSYPQYPGNHPQYPGRAGNYPQQPGSYPQYAGNYPQYPGNYPQYPGSFPQYPAAGNPGLSGGFGGYGGNYINYNPNNRILSPHYGGSLGYGAQGGGWGGSPFSRSVQSMGIGPSDKSKGFGRSAVVAAAGGAVAGMALGYGLGRFPRPHFHFSSPQEEYFYNHYMYRKYGSRSTDANDYSRDYHFSTPPQAFDRFMDSCLKRTDLLPEKGRRSSSGSAQGTTTEAPTAAPEKATTRAHMSDSNSTTAANSTSAAGAANSTSAAGAANSTSAAAAANSTAAAAAAATPTSAAAAAATPTSAPPSILPSGNRSELPPAPLALRGPSRDDEDDDTVSIVEIGYPALIQQMKVKKCTELYVVYSEQFLKKKKISESPAEGNGVHGSLLGLPSFLALLASVALSVLE